MPRFAFARQPAPALVALAALALGALASAARAETPRAGGDAKAKGAASRDAARPGTRDAAGPVGRDAGGGSGASEAAAKSGARGAAAKGGSAREAAAKGTTGKASGAKGAAAKAGASRGGRAGGGKGKPAAHRAGAPGGAEAGHNLHLPSLAPTGRALRCPDDMVAVAGRFCVDRYEATLVEAGGGELLSPYYPPHPKLAVTLLESWSRSREDEPDGSLARFMPLPLLPAHHQTSFRPRAMSWPGSVPSAYVSGELAAEACATAGKRLCKEVEWVTACRGERGTNFPYGERYVQNACNVFREDHPARLLHNDFSNGLLDPRLNLVQAEGKDLLRVTGGTPACVSRWGDDGALDMVGNLDEWVDDARGVFVGGFYARATRSGCDSRVSAHPRSYFDYSTGVRCCKDP